MAPPAGAAKPAIDHLVFATPDLDRTVEDLSGLMGVRAAPGGRHVGRGTHNALLHLGGRTYLEIIGPDPAQDLPDGTALPFRIDLLEQPRLVWYAVATTELTATVEQLRAGGFDAGDVFEMQRARPDGVLLRWVLATHGEVPQGGVVPFLIDWLDSPHPSGDTPQGCTLLELHAVHPDPGSIRTHLGLLGLDVSGGATQTALTLGAGMAAGLTARIDTPQGVIELR